TRPMPTTSTENSSEPARPTPASSVAVVRPTKAVSMTLMVAEPIWINANGAANVMISTTVAESDDVSDDCDCDIYFTGNFASGPVNVMQRVFIGSHGHCTPSVRTQRNDSGVSG